MARLATCTFDRVAFPLQCALSRLHLVHSRTLSASSMKSGAPPSLFHHLLLGGSSCAVATTITHPLDTVKLRLQLRSSVTSSTPASYTNIFSAFSTISRSEGVLSLYSGLSPAIFRAGTYSATRLGLYSPLRSFLSSRLQQDTPSFSVKLASSMLSGVTGAFVGNPFELVKVRMQGAYAGTYRNVLHGCMCVVREDGFKGLWKGTSAAMVRAGLLTSAQLATYDQCKTELKNRVGVDEGLVAHVGAAMMAGVVTTTASTPADLVKSLVMSEKIGVGECVKRVLKEEGLRGFMRGWTANYARLGPHTLVTVVAYEKIREGMGWGNL